MQSLFRQAELPEKLTLGFLLAFIISAANYSSALSAQDWASLASKANDALKDHRYSESIDLWLKAQDLAKKGYGKNHMFYTASLRGLADAYFAAKKMDLAEKYTKEEIEQVKALSPSFPALSHDYMLLGCIYTWKGELEKAKEYLDKARDLSFKDPVNKDEIGPLICRMMVVYRAMGLQKGYDELKAELRKLLSIRTRESMADFYLLEGYRLSDEPPYNENRELAKQYLLTVLDLYDQPYTIKGYQPSPATFSVSKCNYGHIQVLLGEYDKAMANFNEALKMQRALVPPEKDKTARTLENIGWALGRMGKFDEGKSPAREAAALYSDKGDRAHAERLLQCLEIKKRP